MVPIFIRLRNIGTGMASDDQDSIAALAHSSSLPLYLQRLVLAHPKMMHLMLDGFDELSENARPKFEDLVIKALERGYSITVTVRDYQTRAFQVTVPCIVQHKTLHPFDDNKMEECFEKLLRIQYPEL